MSGVFKFVYKESISLHSMTSFL